jgi:Peptidase family M28
VRLLPLLLVAALLVGCDSGGASEPAPRPATPPRAISEAELGAHLEALQRIADENGGIRAAGTPGYDASADYVAARLREAGWRVTRQPVPFRYFRLDSASLTIAGRKLTRSDDFQVLSYSGSGRVTGSLRRSGTACEPSMLAGLGSGQIPLADEGDCFFRVKARNAERAGAPALVVAERVRSRRGVPSGTLAVPGIRIPVVVVSLRALGDAGDGDRASVMVDALARSGRTDNVIAETPGGSGDDVVMAGGHLDSVYGGPGVNDNGSGAATLIEAAEAIGPNPPGARVRFGFWAAEELGLVGSRHYVGSLGRDERRSIRAYLNFDMVGSPNAVPELYGDGDPGLGRVLRQAAGNTELGEAEVGGASDHAAFEAAGIPVNGLYTGSTERGAGARPRDACYHLACDTQGRVNRPVLLRMARTAAMALKRLSGQAK